MQFELQLFFLFEQHDHRAHHTDGLCRHGGDGRTGGIQVQPGHQKQIAEDIHDAGYQHEQQRRLAVTKAAEDGRKHIIGHNEEDACTADAHIAGRQVQRFRRGLHQHRDAPGKPHQRHEQHGCHQGKHHRAAADDLPDILGPLFTQIAGDEHRDAHGELGDHEGDEVEHLAAGGHRRQARGAAKAAHHQQIHCAVGRLQHQCAQNGQHEQGQLFQDAALREIRTIIFQGYFSFHTSPDKRLRGCGWCTRRLHPRCRPAPGPAPGNSRRRTRGRAAPPLR